MNIKELHPVNKEVSAVSIFKGTGEAITAIQVMANHELKEHVSKVPALLLCIDGEVLFENEKGLKESLFPGDYINIETMIKHWVKGIDGSQLILIK
jgi:quercetin dioxygenase-like cupin family protein